MFPPRPLPENVGLGGTNSPPCSLNEIRALLLVLRKTKYRCHTVKGDRRMESVGFKGVINVFTVVLSAPRSGYGQRHGARGGGREIKMIPKP